MARIEVIGEQGEIETIVSPEQIEVQGKQGQIEVDQGEGHIEVEVQEDVIELQIIGGRGPSGPQGEKGDKGDKGDTGADATYTHIQDIPASTWSITHGLGKMPSVTVVDSAGTQVEGEVLYILANQVDVVFTAAFAGKAYLN